MNAYRIHFDGGTPPILREAENEQWATWEGEDYLVEILDDPFLYIGVSDADPEERVRCVERLVPERGSNA